MVYHRVIDEHPPNIGVRAAGLTGESLSQQEMYVRSNFALPTSPPAGFDLVIAGKRPRFINPDRLQALEEVNRDIVLECAGNGRALMSPVPDGTAWKLDGVSAIRIGGYRLRDVLGSLPDEVVEVVFTGADAGAVPPDGRRVPYQFSISRELAESSAPMLVTHIGDEPLSVLHGGPIRLVVPGHYAMKSVKWLNEVRTVTAPFRGHFVEKYRYYGDQDEPEGAPVSEIAVRSVISSPEDGDVVAAGHLAIEGSAWSDGSEITRVVVSTDGGASWQEADLHRRQTGGRWAPVAWAHIARPEPGRVEIMARAEDAGGAIQPLEPRWNAKGYANNVVHRVVVEAVRA